MAVVLTVSSLAGGTVLACLCDRYPRVTKQLEFLAGVAIVFGLVMIGKCLPVPR